MLICLCICVYVYLFIDLFTIYSHEGLARILILGQMMFGTVEVTHGKDKNLSVQVM